MDSEPREHNEQHDQQEPPSPFEDHHLPVGRDAWMPVVMGQVAGGFVPPHPGPPEAPDDELTQAALSDPCDVRQQEEDVRPTFWRVLVLVLIAVAALSIVFRFAR
jgi:hypothetical protein